MTVLTPTYNRAHTLPRLYESLVAQTFTDFEWVVVDDGSEDDTAGLLHAWSRGQDIQVHAARQNNLGQFAAVNLGLEHARGEFTTIVDSDDWLPPDSLATLFRRWREIPSEVRAQFSGIVGLCATPGGRVIGDPFPSDPLDCDAIELIYRYRIEGDKHSLLRTQVMREYPFPAGGTWAYVTPQLVWNRMALRYRERHVNDIVKFVDYQAGGLSDSWLELAVRSPTYIRLFFSEEAQLPHSITRGRRVKARVNYARFSFHADAGLWRQFIEAPSRVWWPVLAPLGYALAMRDRRRLLRRSTD